MGFLSVLSLVVQVAGGAVVLLFGRRLFWLFVALTGFVLGLWLVRMFTDAAPNLIGILIAFGVGLGGIVLVRAVQHFVFSFLGFLGGGILALIIANLAQGGGNGLDWTDVLTFIVGAFIGAFLLARFADWGLIALSALLGANAITGAIGARVALHPTAAILMIVLLFFVGVSVQSGGANPFAGQAAPAIFDTGSLSRFTRKKSPVVARQQSAIES